MNEREQAIKYANLVLDVPYGDPDSDLAVLARQFLRSSERQVAESAPSDDVFDAWAVQAQLFGTEYDDACRHAWHASRKATAGEILRNLKARRKQLESLADKPFWVIAVNELDRTIAEIAREYGLEE